MLERGGNGGGGDRACSLAEERVAIPLEIHARPTNNHTMDRISIVAGIGHLNAETRLGAPDEAREVGQLLKSTCGVVPEYESFHAFLNA